MKIEVLFPPSLSGTVTENRLLALLEIYGEVDGTIEAWRRGVKAACPPGCGACCEHFEPQVASVEAELVAVFLLQTPRRHEILRPIVDDEDPSPLRGGQPCRFFRPSLTKHCRIYPVRPLVCRMYGFTASTNKMGNPTLRPCAHMGLERRILSEPELRAMFGNLPPELSGLGRALALLCPEGPAPLEQALAAAWGKILLLASLAGDTGNSGSGKPPRITGPKAA